MERVPPGESRAALVCDNLDAFAMRVRAARAARHTLDLQYYHWHEDVTGTLLLAEVLAAADRGVRVRLLLDDLYVRKAERALATLDAHPCVEVRLYNPFHLRRGGTAGDLLEFLWAGWRLNHRMHNKLWVTDGVQVIGGGRNIGDEYFDASSQFNFRDLDLVVAGPAATGALPRFERYWASPWARPIQLVVRHRPSHGDLGSLRRDLQAAREAPAAGRYLGRLAERPQPGGTLVTLDPAVVRFVADPPGKGKDRRRDPVMLREVSMAMTQARRQVLIVSPYFVPGRRGARSLLALRRRGVEVAVLTNSLAATDVLAVHGGYARYRRRLLRAGVRLHEMKRGGQQGGSLLGSGRASLHTKAFLVDGEELFVGSYNLDPRSAHLNTEGGCFVRHPELAAALAAEFSRLTATEHSWAVRLEGHRLSWRDGGPPLHHEPDTSLSRRVLARIAGWLPIEAHL
ncbi:phospholipase D family protein [Roseococcus sp. DSY-14]